MADERRTNMTGVLWLFSVILLSGLFISAAAQGALTSGHIALAIVILGLAVAGTLMILYSDAFRSDIEKAKRQSADNILHNLSDEDLIELKHRLAAIELSDEPIIEYLDDDGELRQRR